MSKFADALVSAVNMDLTKLDIPELGELEAYFTPMTLNDSKKIRVWSKDSNEDFIVYTVIHKLLDKNGNKLMDIGDKTTLLNRVPFEILTKIVREINGSSQEEDFEDIEGN